MGLNRGLNGIVAPGGADNLMAAAIKGDLYVFTGPGQLTRLPVGTSDGQSLTVSAAQANGIQWTTVKGWKGVWGTPLPSIVYDFSAGMPSVFSTDAANNGPFVSANPGGTGAPPDTNVMFFNTGFDLKNVETHLIVPVGITNVSYYVRTSDHAIDYYVNGTVFQVTPTDGLWHQYSFSCVAGQKLAWFANYYHGGSTEGYAGHIALAAGTVYNAGDITYYKGVFYTSLIDSNGSTPGSSSWTALYAKTSGLRTITRAMFR